MDKTTISESLRALAKETSTRSQIGRVREVFDDIETAQRSGATMAEIVETLNRQGFEISLTSLQTALARIRKQRRDADGIEPSRKMKKQKAEPAGKAPAQTPADLAPSGKKAVDAKALLGDLAGTPKVGGYSPIPKEGFEIDESEKRKK